MSDVIVFQVQDGKLELGKSSSTCFGCGEKTSSQQLVHFEDTDTFGIVGRTSSLLKRTSFSIPVCHKCENIISYCRKKIALWGVVFLVAIFSVF